MSDDGDYDWGFDLNGDPLQSGLQLHGNYGVSKIDGPVLGVVLNVHASDSPGNLLLRTLQGDSDGQQKAAYIEADVLVLQSDVEENWILPHCIVTQQKSSRIGPSEDEPADFTEDIPNGSTAQEIDALYSGQSLSASDMSGDWVLVDFIGGVVQFPVIRGWFSSPYNLKDSALGSDGKRYRFRRNNSGFTIDKRGDFTITHRTGQYIQFQGKSITIKHRQGGVIHLDEDGSVSVTDQYGHTYRSGDTGILITTGETSLELQDAGQRISLVAPGGAVTVAGTSLNLIGETVVATDGDGGGSAVAKQPTVSAVLIALKGISALIGVFETIFGIPPLSVLPPVVGLKLILAGIKAPIDAAADDIVNNSENYLTSVLRGE